MHIAVTGAAGRLGRAVATRLRELDHEVQAIDRTGDAARERRIVHADLRDLGQTYGALAGSEAVIHLAAIPAPIGQPPELVFGTNTASTFHVFEAAATLGIRRVVSASSVSALGFPFQHRWSEPLYLPIDEEHPLLPQDCYGLSKEVGEAIAAAYVRRGAGSAASLRFSTILSGETYRGEIEDVRADPGRHAQYLWSYVDVRDAAEACILAATVEYQGHHPLYITAGDTLSEEPTEALLDRYFPNVQRRPGQRPARWSLLDIARAGAVIGYRPRFRWQEIVPS